MGRGGETDHISKKGIRRVQLQCLRGPGKEGSPEKVEARCTGPKLRSDLSEGKNQGGEKRRRKGGKSEEERTGSQ